MDKLASKRLIVGIGEEELHPDIVTREKDRLLNWYQGKLEEGTISWKLKNEKLIRESVDANAAKAINGYPRAPIKETPELTFITRLGIFTKYDKDRSIWSDEEYDTLINAKRSRNLARKLQNLEEHQRRILEAESRVVQEVNTKDDDAIEEYKKSSVYMNLEEDVERLQYILRRSAYEEEFEFNKSSDYILLESVLADEILLFRLTKDRMAGLDKKKLYDDYADELNKRIRENLKLLGVSRTQRMSDDTSTRGSIAEVSIKLDEKLDNIRKLKDPKLRDQIMFNILDLYAEVSVQDLVDAAEELKMMRLRALRPEMKQEKPIPTVNEIPEYSSIDKAVASLQPQEEDRVNE